MNTKYLMMSSAVIMGLAGIAASFFPEEIQNNTGLTANTSVTLIIQIIGALYLGFALMNWMAKTVLIGGIYSKPLAMGNFFHFAVAALALIKETINSEGLNFIWIATVLYSVFAILFGLVVFTAPAKKDQLA